MVTSISETADRGSRPRQSTLYAVVLQESAFCTPRIVALTSDPKSLLDKLSGADRVVQAVGFDMDASVSLPASEGLGQLFAIVTIGPGDAAEVCQLSTSMEMAEAFLESYNSFSDVTGRVGIAIPAAWSILG